jgi:AcrR family transcriptional regulator
METRTARGGRQRILEIAEELFTERGYRAVSIRDIARGCAITSAALYYHFPSKEALFGAVLEQHAANLNSRMRRAGEAAGSFRERAAAMLVEYTRAAADRRSPIFLMRREREAGQGGGRTAFDPRQAREQQATLVHAMLRPLEELLRQAVQRGELKPLPTGYSPAALLVGMLHGQVQYRLACQGASLSDEDVDQVVKVFWEGMRVINKGEEE